MTPENQALLDAIGTMITEATAPLGTRLERLETRMERLEGRVETLDARTGQMASDLLYLRDRVPLLEERIDNGLRALKSDLSLAFSDTRKVSVAQDRSDRTIEVLKRELAGLQQRLAALEGTKGTL